jgi:hypothetical protein
MIYWTFKSVPELARLPRKERRRVHEQCLRRHFWLARATARSLTAYVASIFTTVIVVFLATSIPQIFGITYHLWFVLASAFVGFEIAGFVFSRIAIPVLRPFYYEFTQRDETHVA